MWTLVVFVAAGGPSIVVDGFARADDCARLGQLNVDHMQYELPAQFQCNKTGRPPVRCRPDTRQYGRTAECLHD